MATDSSVESDPQGAVASWLLQLSRDRPVGARGNAIVHLLATRPEYGSYATTKDIAQQAGVDPSTVTRTSHALGFDGWPALRLELRTRLHYAKSASEIVQEQPSRFDNPVMRAVAIDIDNLTALAHAPQREAVSATARAILSAERTLVVGSGSYAAPAVQLAYTAGVAGNDVRFIERGGTSLVNAVLQLRPEDCFIAFSFWRIPKELLEATRLAYERGVQTCVVTDLARSAFAALGRNVITVPTESLGYFPSLTACSTVVNAIIAVLFDLSRERAIEHLREAEDTWHRFDLNQDYSS